MKMAHAPPGHHSVVGRPSVGGLSFPEYVVYRGEQVQPPFTSFDDFFFRYQPPIFPLQAYPEYLICYQIVKPEASASDSAAVELTP